MVYTGVTIAVLLATAGGVYGMGRYLLPAFTPLLPVAVGMAKVRLRDAVAVFVVLGLVSGWYGTSRSLVWSFSP